MLDYLKVSGEESLVRDVNTHAIINTNSVEYDSFIKRKNQLIEQQNQLQQNTIDINNIKSELSEIKELLYLAIKNKGL